MKSNFSDSSCDTKKSEIEVIAMFSESGDIIPRRLRYFDLEMAQYVCRDVVEINYIMKENRDRIFSLDLNDDTRRRIAWRDDQWFFI